MSFPLPILVRRERVGEGAEVPPQRSGAAVGGHKVAEDPLLAFLRGARRLAIAHCFKVGRDGNCGIGSSNLDIGWRALGDG